MSLHSVLPVYKASYDLLLSIFEFARNFKKEYKYTVGESIKKETITLLTLIYPIFEVFIRQSKSERCSNVSSKGGQV